MAERIIEQDINQIASESFIDYAREVIMSRALPDIRDGLKPVQRRILYAMKDMGLRSDEPYRKSARIVGEVLGKYHPHGDTSVYEALVKMAQDFNRRAILIDGHGNFGSVDGDSAAAMRYTECRLSPIAEQLVGDLDKNTVEWQPNFDDSEKEPTVLPALFPNLLVNGESGIAVGIATNIPPHNLWEVIDGICAYIDDHEIDTKGLLKYIKGPDFPTGGIVAPAGILNCYETGRGPVVVRSKANMEELPGNRQQIVITEIPYQIKKTKLVEKMALYIRDHRKEDDVVEVRDESNRDGIRIVIEMDRGGNAEKLLEELYAKTELQVNFNYNLLALVDGKPKTLSLRDMVAEYVKHRKEIITKRTQHDLAKLNARAHILEGLIVAVDKIDKVISLIRKSKSPQDAREGLVATFAFTEIQAQAILDLRLQRLTALEIQTLEKEMKTVQKEIATREAILSSDNNLYTEMKRELEELKNAFPSPRKTLIRPFDKVQLEVKVEKFTVQVNENGKIKRLAENYSGDKGLTLKTDSAKHLLFFTREGTLHKYTNLTLPQQLGGEVLALCNEEDIAEDATVTFITTDGQVKKTAFQEYKAVKSNSQTLKFQDPDAKVAQVFIGDIGSDLILFTHKGMGIRFDHTDIREMGRMATGVRGINLEEGDHVIAAFTVESDAAAQELTIVTGPVPQKIPLSQIRKQNRGGKGVRVKMLKQEALL